MSITARYIEFALGLFFIASAASKAVNMEGFQVQVILYGVIKDPLLVHIAAYGTVLIETALGALFVGGLRLNGATAAAATLLTVVFTGLIAYAWRWKGLEDCGCFGDYVKLSPLQSILKNVALIGFIGWAWYGTRLTEDTANRPRLQTFRYTLAGVAGVVMLVMLGLTYRAPAESKTLAAGNSEGEKRPYAQFVFDFEGQHFDLGQGNYLVAMLNADCDHCRASVPMLNELFLASENAEVVGMVSGNPEQLEDFRSMTEPLFATSSIDMLVQMQFVDPAPPRLIRTEDGREVSSWNWKDTPPTIEAVLGTETEAIMPSEAADPESSQGH